MNYELAKELKDAGFPLKEYRYAADVLEGGFVEPILEELIAACEKKCGRLQMIHFTDFWWVAPAPSKYGLAECKAKNLVEALGGLWLALNKHEYND